MWWLRDLAEPRKWGMLERYWEVNKGLWAPQTESKAGFTLMELAVMNAPHALGSTCGVARLAKSVEYVNEKEDEGGRQLYG